MDDKPIRIAQIMGRMNSGGVEAVVMNYYRAVDKSRIQFDFFVDQTCAFPQKEEILEMGGRFFLVPSYDHPIPYIRRLKRLFSENRYAVVHAHINTMNVLPLLAAWLMKIPVRICHNHSTASFSGERFRTILKYILRPFAKLFATDYFACGESAACWMYGKRCVRRKKVRILPNAIDVNRYRFDIQSREVLRGNLGIDDKTLVVGHIGRFAHQKNHAFLIDIFRALHEADANSILLLIGEGELKDDIRQKVDALNLGSAVRFLGVRMDANRLYSAMDVFCLPSFYEGFPVVLVEAQANGLPCVIADNIARESILQTNVIRLGLDQPTEEWTAGLRTNVRTKSRSALYTLDIRMCAKRLETFYLLRAAQ